MGVPTEQLDKIQQQMVGFNNLFAPYYLPRVSVEEVDSKNVVVIWAPVGINRPFIETDEDRSYFLMYIPVHEGCGNVVTLKENTENYPNITPLLPHYYAKHFGIDYAKSENDSKAIERSFRFV